jgi:hypothetical protein
LNGLKSGKDRTEPRVLFVCFALERKADTDSHRELSHLPPSFDDDRYAFGTATLRDFHR